jgi:group I intron endonuclease
MEHKPGVYQILNLVNGKRYIGSSADVKCRVIIHVARLRGGYHPNRHLQSAWNKYGESSFLLEAVEYAEDSVSCEQVWIDFCKPEYNASTLATGIAHTEESRRKISQGRTKWLSEGGAAHLSVVVTSMHEDPVFRARWLAGVSSEATKAKISAGVRAKTADKEWLAKRNAAIKASWVKCRLANA